jgi:hypothetical protein
MTQLYPPATAADTTHAKASAAKRLRSSRLLVTYLDRRPGLRLDSEAMGQHELAEEFVGSNQASATKFSFPFSKFYEPRNHPN